MKPFVLFLGLCLLAAPPLRPAEPETLFSPSAPLFPAHGGPGLKTLFLEPGTALLVGGSGSLLLSEHWGLGAGGYSLANSLVVQRPGYKQDLGLSFGGVVVDYSFLPKSLFYLNVSSMAGLGQAFAVPRLTGADRVQSNFYFIDTQFNLMLNVTREFRLGIGAGLFASGGAQLRQDLGTELTGVNAQLILFYGKL